MQGSGRVPQWFAGQLSSPDPWGVLPASVCELACPYHSAERIGTVAAPDGGLCEREQFGTLVPSYRVEVGQDLIKQWASGRRNAPPRPFIAAAFPLLPESLARHSDRLRDPCRTDGGPSSRCCATPHSPSLPIAGKTPKSPNLDRAIRHLCPYQSSPSLSSSSSSSSPPSSSANSSSSISSSTSSPSSDSSSSSSSHWSSTSCATAFASVWSIPG